MDATRRSLGLVLSLSTFVIPLVGCGRAAPEEIVGTTSTTSASVAVASPVAPQEAAAGEPLTCSRPGEAVEGESREGEGAACVGAGVPAPTVAPVIVTTHATHPKAKRPLDEAITARVAADEGDDDHTAAPPPTSPSPAPAPTPPPVEQAPRPSARVAYDSHLSNAYRLQRLRMLVDGVVAYDGPTAGSVQTTPGDHVVEVIANYRINDPVFTYVGDYGVELRSTQVIETATAPVVFVATATPKGNATTPIGQRAGLAWRSFPDRQTVAAK